MEAFLDISGRLVLALVGLQIAGAIVAGFRGLTAALIFGVGMFAGATLMLLVQPPTGIDGLWDDMELFVMTLYLPGALILVATLLAIALWAIRRLLKWRRSQ